MQYTFQRCITYPERPKQRGNKVSHGHNLALRDHSLIWTISCKSLAPERKRLGIVPVFESHFSPLRRFARFRPLPGTNVEKSVAEINVESPQWMLLSNGWSEQSKKSNYYYIISIAMWTGFPQRFLLHSSFTNNATANSDPSTATSTSDIIILVSTPG